MAANAITPNDQAIEQSRSEQLRPYLDKFRDWAIDKAQTAGQGSGAFMTIEHLREWDRQHNHNRIRKSFGTDADVREAGLQALYWRVLSGYLTLGHLGKSARALPASDLEVGVTIRSLLGGIYIPEMSDHERIALIEQQVLVIKRATQRLQYYKMPRDKLINLFRELEAAI